MIKNSEFIARKDGMSEEAFFAAAKAHGEKLKAISGVKGHLLHNLLPTAVRPDIPRMEIADFDTISEIYFDSLEARRELEKSGPFKDWLDGRKAFVGKIKSMVAKEDPLVPVPKNRPPMKNHAFLNRRAGMTYAEFINEWHVLHGPMGRGVPHLLGFVLNDIIAETPPAGFEPLITGNIEGCAQAWYESTDTQKLMVQTPEAKEWFKHGGVTFGKIRGQNTTEIVIKPIAG